MTTEPQVQVRPAQPYVGVRRTVTMSTISEVADRIPDLMGLVAQQGVEPGAPFLRYLVIDMERALVIEAGVPVPDATAVRPQGEAFSAELPAGRYAVARHHGHPDDLLGATAELLRWADEQGLEWDRRDSAEGDVWGCRLELYLSDPREVAMDDWDTDLVFRLAD